MSKEELIEILTTCFNIDANPTEEDTEAAIALLADTSEQRVSIAGALSSVIESPLLTMSEKVFELTLNEIVAEENAKNFMINMWTRITGEQWKW